MNMYGMEKVARAHIDDMRRDTQDAQLLRGAAQAGDPAKAPGGSRVYVAAAGLALTAVLVALLLLSAGIL